MGLSHMAFQLLTGVYDGSDSSMHIFYTFESTELSVPPVVT